MILGHCIQNGNGKIFLEKQLFWDDYFFKFIYSFHMPLFALISGYFLNLSTNKYELKVGILKKINYLFPPIVIFGVYRYFLSRCLIIKDDIIFKFVDLIFTILKGYWFLWSILYFSIIIFIVKYIFNDSIKIYVALFLILFIIPNEIHTVKTSTILFLYPFILVGYFFSKYQKQIIKKIESKQNQLLFILGVFFCLQLFFFKKESYIYISGLDIIKTKLNISLRHQFFIDVFRLNIGLTGSCFILLILYKIYKLTKSIKVWNIFIDLGQNSLKIYCVQELVIVYWLVPFTINYQKNYKTNLLESIIVILLCLFINRILSKFKMLSRIHFGIR
ncbi:acyltransferase family protein [Fusobacterium animalis]|uniref:acyltransferase family protein n=1 Tax=Fusobacterium animalis TaxID=76859 RepID=UPI001C6EE8CA|nr:acyltransferase family protein [Fusobacterium animalis]QYR63957.1 acyltransferase family protein [Fusobacterium animalis]